MTSSSSSTLQLSLVLLLMASSSSAAAWGGGGLTHFRFYMQETTEGPGATRYVPVPPKGNGAEFGAIELLDNPLYVGPDPSKSVLFGRFQGLVAFAGMVTPPGMQSAVTFVFTAGRYTGSTVVVVGTVVSFDGAFERPIVGGTGAFRMARGYCTVKSLWNPTPVSNVYEVNLFVQMPQRDLQVIETFTDLDLLAPLDMDA